MSETLHELLMKLPKETLIGVMMNSLDIMQSWNGQSRTNAIMCAIGADETDDGKWKVPSIEKIKKHATGYL